MFIPTAVVRQAARAVAEHRRLTEDWLNDADDEHGLGEVREVPGGVERLRLRRSLHELGRISAYTGVGGKGESSSAAPELGHAR
jgi:hypothetical protein